MVCSSLSNAVNSLETPPLSSMIESVYILGGSSVYAVSQLCIKILYSVFIYCRNHAYHYTGSCLVHQFLE